MKNLLLLFSLISPLAHSAELSIFEPLEYENLVIKLSDPSGNASGRFQSTGMGLEVDQVITVSTDFGRQQISSLFNRGKLIGRTSAIVTDDEIRYTSIMFPFKSYTDESLNIASVGMAFQELSPAEQKSLVRNNGKLNTADEVLNEFQNDLLIVPDYQINGHTCWLELQPHDNPKEISYECSLRNPHMPASMLVVASSDWNKIEIDTSLPTDPSLFDTSIPGGFNRITAPFAEERNPDFEDELDPRVFDDQLVDRHYARAMELVEELRGVTTNLINASKSGQFPESAEEAAFAVEQAPSAEEDAPDEEELNEEESQLKKLVDAAEAVGEAADLLGSFF